MSELTRAERFKDARLVYNQHGSQTMNAVQNATGVSASLIADLENEDKDRKANYLDVATLAKHYGVTVDWLCCLSNDHHITPCASNELGLSEESIYALKALNDVPLLFDKMWGSKNDESAHTLNQQYWDTVNKLQCLGGKTESEYYPNFLAMYAMDLINFLINIVVENYTVVTDYFDLRELNPIDWDTSVEHISFDDFVRFKAGEIAKVIDRWLVEEFRNHDACFVYTKPVELPRPGQLSFDDIHSTD